MENVIFMHQRSAGIYIKDYTFQELCYIHSGIFVGYTFIVYIFVN